MMERFAQQGSHQRVRELRHPVQYGVERVDGAI